MACAVRVPRSPHLKKLDQTTKAHTNGASSVPSSLLPYPFRAGLRLFALRFDARRFDQQRCVLRVAFDMILLRLFCSPLLSV